MDKALSNASAQQKDWESKISTTRAALEQATAKVSAMDETTRRGGEAWNAYQSQLNNAEAKLKALKTSTGDTSQEQAKLESQIGKLKAKMSELDASTNGSAKAAGELLREQQSLSNQLSQEERKYGTCTSAVNKYATQLNEAKIKEGELDAELTRTNQYLDEAEASADGCATSIDRFGREVRQSGEEMESGNTALQNTQQGLETLSSILITAGIARGIREIGDALGECVGVSGDFEYAMATVAAVSGASDAELAQLTQTAKDYAASSVFTASEVSSAYNYMGMAGWEASDMLSGLPGIMSLSAASGEDLGGVCDIVTDALTAFGLAAGDAAHFSDVLAEASSDSNTTVALLGESFQMVGAQAGTLGYSIEDVTIALGAMANSGIKGSEAGTQLATALTRMAGGNESAAAAMETLKISMFDSNGQARALWDVLGDLRASFDGLTDAEKNNYAYQLAGQKGMRGLLSIVNASDEDWDNLTASIYDCSGAASEMSDIKLDTYTGQVKLLESATEALQIEIGNQLQPALEDVLGVGTDLMDWTKDFISDNKAAIPIVTGLATSLGVATVAIGGGTAAIKLATAATELFGATLNAAFPILGGISAVVGAAAAAFVYFNSCIADVGTQYTETLDSIEASSTAWEEQYSSLTNTETATASLMRQLKNLTEVEGKSAAQKQSIKSVVATLNELVPELNLAYDEQADVLNMATDSVEEYIQYLLAQAKAEAIISRLSELMLEQADIERDLAACSEDLADANEAAQDGHWDTALAAHKLTTQYEDLTAAQQENADQQAFLNDQLAEVTSTVESYSGNVDDATAATEDLADATEITVAEMSEYLQELDDAYLSTMEAGVDSAREQAGAWNDLAGEAEYSMGELLANMQQYLDQETSYFDNLSAIAQKYGEDVAAMYADNSTASVEAAAVLASATDDQIASYMDLYSQTTGYLDGITESLYSYSQDVGAAMDSSAAAAAAADNTGSAYEASLRSHDESIAGAAEDVAVGSVEAMDVADEMEEQGSANMEGQADGISAGASSVVSASESVSGSVVQAADIYDEMYTSGVNAVSGLCYGIQSMLPSAAGIGQRLGNTLLGSFRATVGEGSPWRTMIASGEYAGEGLCIGLSSGLAEAVRTMRQGSMALVAAAQPEIDLSSIHTDFSSARTAQLRQALPVSNSDTGRSGRYPDQTIILSLPNGREFARAYGKDMGGYMAWEVL